MELISSSNGCLPVMEGCLSSESHDSEDEGKDDGHELHDCV